ncbi:uncharacterized protein DUF3106 [Variovorax beijingensis]|uniref:DUF3106 domain-containing protein n=2 Tax=Variovorax TaxID=34072 RepID=A0AAE4BYF5_VARPD|nr:MULTISPECIES: DUF3106 domain-containing protein [Variovorax]MBD9665749.1 DUF3106 domain-containing protein [Variovorax sp. VRV01]MDP9967774.1 hypothetical protein [Variovorax paradoxus]MDR6429091.1 hypothetical protein [Variovorax paradoxus]MDR6453797.1 hypothetical protein [Variovorax paradoxus]TWD86453.1 uncharacterized protein DUF3106 [Variovorax beijingensis]
MRRPPVSRTDTPRPLRPPTSGAVIWAGVLAAALFGLTLADAQTHSEPKSAGSGAQAASPSSASKTAPATKPYWSELTAEQQQALRPLASHWHALNPGHKRKWLALSRNYANMSADDQSTLHSRMIEWAALSNQQRAQARLNFAEVKRVPADERKAKWEQYQALSEDEKRRLAARAPAKPRGAAIPVRPVPAQKLVTVPAVTPAGQHTPRIMLAPPASPAAAPSAAIMVASPPERVPPVVSTPSPSGASGAPAATSALQPIPAEAQVPMPSAAVQVSPPASASNAAGRAVEQATPP